MPGLNGTLGKNGVTPNYRADLAPVVRGLAKGRALFTQPPMPIKGAGAPQKAMYDVLQPTFPWLIDGTKPSRLERMLKKDWLPTIYWDAMLKSHEWLAAPKPFGGAGQ